MGWFHKVVIKVSSFRKHLHSLHSIFSTTSKLRCLHRLRIPNGNNNQGQRISYFQKHLHSLHSNFSTTSKLRCLHSFRIPNGNNNQGPRISYFQKHLHSLHSNFRTNKKTSNGNNTLNYPLSLAEPNQKSKNSHECDDE
jgi:hypothetical protein